MRTHSLWILRAGAGMVLWLACGALSLAQEVVLDGGGPVAPAPAAAVPVEPVAAEKFVPGSGRGFASATLELRSEVHLIGQEVKLRNVCRWPDGDKATFDPVAELILFRLKPSSPFRTITMEELRQTLREAGVNLAVIRLAGATSCTVARTDVKYDERTALEQWIHARDPGATPAATETGGNAAVPAKTPAEGAAAEGSRPAAAAASARLVRGGDHAEPAQPEQAIENRTLRQYLINETAERLGIAVEQLQFTFNPADDKVLNLSEPFFKFNVRPPRGKNLGEMSWDVTILAGEATRKVSVTATAKAWQSQVVIAKPLGYRQVIRDEDLIERRTLADRLSEDPLITRQQAVGQMSSRELKPGSVMTARLVEPTLLVKAGQLVTILLTQGGIQAKTVARAMEQGTLGQSIRVKNEVTNNTFDVIVTGPQTAELPATGSSVPRAEVIQAAR